MAKKSFRDDLNPAMNFITPDSKKKAENTSSEGKIKNITEIRNNAPEGYKVNPLYIETRSKRLQILIQPSIYEKIKSRADSEGVSVNEVINSIFIKAFEEGETE